MPEAPATLIDTWIKLLMSHEDQIIKDKARDNLINHFGSIEDLVQYIRNHHDIPVK